MSRRADVAVSIDMPYRLNRSELYDLVWSEPMRTLATRFGVSDVALGKACRKAHIPLPGLGYWSKRQGGKRTVQIGLPARGIGMSDEVIIGGSRYDWTYGPSNEEILGPVPPPPSFEEEIADLRERIVAEVRTVKVPKTLVQIHPLIRKLLDEDERRREKQRTSPYSFSWDAPLHDSPQQRRRLRILNSIFLALAKAGAKPSLHGKEILELSAVIGDQDVGLNFDGPPERHQYGREKPAFKKLKEGQLRFEIKSTRHGEEIRNAWQDTEADKIESRVTEIVVELLAAAELQYREACDWGYQRRLERRTQLQEEERKRKEAAEREERERQIRLENERIERLLSDAAALKQANDIRAYVKTVAAARAASPEPFAEELLLQWAAWAESQADRIDPIVNGSFSELFLKELAAKGD